MNWLRAGYGQACGEVPLTSGFSFLPASSSWCLWHVGSSHRNGIGSSRFVLPHALSLLSVTCLLS